MLSRKRRFSIDNVAGRRHRRFLCSAHATTPLAPPVPWFIIIWIVRILTCARGRPSVWARQVTIWLHVLQGFGGAEVPTEGRHGHWWQHVRTTQGRGRKVSVSGPNAAGLIDSTPFFWALPRPTHTSNHNLVSIPLGVSVLQRTSERKRRESQGEVPEVL